MDRAVVKLDTLADADGAGAEDEDFLFGSGRIHLVLDAVVGVIVGGLRRELRSTGIDHGEGGDNIPHLAHVEHGALCHAQISRDHIVRKANTLGLAQGILITDAAAQHFLHVGDILETVEKPQIDLGDLVNLLQRDALKDGDGHRVQALVVHIVQLLTQLLHIQLHDILVQQRGAVLLQGVDGLLQRALKGT